MFSSTVANQALLSASNLLVGLILIRSTADAQYGYYVLVFNSILLLNSLQGAYLHPPLAIRLATAEPAAAAALVGGLFRAQNALLVRTVAVALVLLAFLWFTGLADGGLALLLLTGILAIGTALLREFFRTVFFVSRLPLAVIKSDAVYIVGQLAGVWFATQTSVPAVSTLATSSVAALVASAMLGRALVIRNGLDRTASPEVWREIAATGTWSAAGAASHWTFSQGYNYIVASVVDVAAVSAIAATRLLMMPINLLSVGMGPLMMPFAAEWVQTSGREVVLRRTIIIATGLTALSGCYLLVLWLAQDWIFDHLMHKHYPHAGALMAIWSATFLIAIFRDQIRVLPAICDRFKQLWLATTISAGISLVCGYFALRAWGIIGAPLAVLLGEFVNGLYIVTLSLRLVRESRQTSS
jgi:O-antigen/teichoic acid export membrane protein